MPYTKIIIDNLFDIPNTHTEIVQCLQRLISDKVLSNQLYVLISTEREKIIEKIHALKDLSVTTKQVKETRAYFIDFLGKLIGAIISNCQMLTDQIIALMTCGQYSLLANVGFSMKKISVYIEKLEECNIDSTKIRDILRSATVLPLQEVKESLGRILEAMGMARQHDLMLTKQSTYYPGKTVLKIEHSRGLRFSTELDSTIAEMVKKGILVSDDYKNEAIFLAEENLLGFIKSVLIYLCAKVNTKFSIINSNEDSLTFEFFHLGKADALIRYRQESSKHGVFYTFCKGNVVEFTQALAKSGLIKETLMQIYQSNLLRINLKFMKPLFNKLNLSDPKKMRIVEKKYDDCNRRYLSFEVKLDSMPDWICEFLQLAYKKNILLEKNDYLGNASTNFYLLDERFFDFTKLFINALLKSKKIQFYVYKNTEEKYCFKSIKITELAKFGKQQQDSKHDSMIYTVKNTNIIDFITKLSDSELQFTNEDNYSFKKMEHNILLTLTDSLSKCVLDGENIIFSYKKSIRFEKLLNDFGVNAVKNNNGYIINTQTNNMDKIKALLNEISAISRSKRKRTENENANDNNVQHIIKKQHKIDEAEKENYTGTQLNF